MIYYSKLYPGADTGEGLEFFISEADKTPTAADENKRIRMVFVREGEEVIDKERVMLMTKTAMTAKKREREVFPASDYFPEDYVGFQVIKGIIGVTCIYALIVAGWAMYTADTWMTAYTFAQLFDLGRRLLLLYLVIALLSGVILLLVYSLRYYQAKTSLKEEEYNLRRLCRLYDEEERKG